MLHTICQIQDEHIKDLRLCSKSHVTLSCGTKIKLPQKKSFIELGVALGHLLLQFKRAS